MKTLSLNPVNSAILCCIETPVFTSGSASSFDDFINLHTCFIVKRTIHPHPIHMSHPLYQWCLIPHIPCACNWGTDVMIVKLHLTGYSSANI